MKSPPADVFIGTYYQRGPGHGAQNDVGRSGGEGGIKASAEDDVSGDSCRNQVAGSNPKTGALGGSGSLLAGLNIRGEQAD